MTVASCIRNRHSGGANDEGAANSSRAAQRRRPAADLSASGDTESSQNIPPISGGRVVAGWTAHTAAGNRQRGWKGDDGRYHHQAQQVQGQSWWRSGRWQRLHDAMRDVRPAVIVDVGENLVILSVDCVMVSIDGKRDRSIRMCVIFEKPAIDQRRDQQHCDQQHQQGAAPP
ncbi:hypothetical protein [Nocardia cyriacigeorgica]|uniref:hypothetical protein n=1 Tax=Nocardia cyriacigeorgica TaxID=135487 RepID=UPI001032DF36|nr:hypothetical protein [Nocardia cyriacigeorgica]MBF6424050.1 hypothetical protein [Nocardia cyriacigeorgica]TLF56689.1 hypothetical protein FEK31_15720 [Nocardia cyriacigeorgica]